MHNNTESKPIWYRGQNKIKSNNGKIWYLIPQAFRSELNWEQIKDQLRDHEVSRNIHFRLRAIARYHNCPKQEEDAAWLALMQHNLLYTRLLDWTTSFIIAAYFATCDESDEDAIIWILEPRKLNSNTIKTDKVEDIYLGTDLYYILTYNKLEIYSKDLELVDTHDFRDYGISPVIDLVQDRFVVLDWTRDGESNHYLYSIAAGKMKKIDTIPGLYISTIKPLKDDLYVIGYSEITGVFTIPSLKPVDLIELREINFS